jgi:hypothetical protein
MTTRRVVVPQWLLEENRRHAAMIDRNRARFRVLPLDQLRGLRRVDDRDAGCGVYFLWKGPRLIYIGKTNGIGYRLTCHWREGKRFTHATIEDTPEQLAREFERPYVLAYKPRLNRKRLG